MAIVLMTVILNFIIALVVSSLVIFVATKLFGETEGFGTAIVAALIGAVIYTFAYLLLGAGIVASIIGGIAWLVALGSLYNIGWLKAFFVAIIIWLFAALISYVLPTVAGPL